MKSRNYGFFAITILTLLIFGSSINVLATDEDNDGIDDEIEDSKIRTINVETSTNKIEIESTLRQGITKDQIKLEIDYGSEGIDVSIGYESEISDSLANETEYEIEYDVQFRKLVEFVDQNDNGIYESSIDDTVQVYNLDSFQPAFYNSTNLSLDTTLHYILINSTDGVFAAHFYLVEEFAIINNSLITPSSLKIDIEITNFNYLNPNSQLALYIKLGSSNDYEEEDNTEYEREGYSSDEKGVITELNNYVAAFNWKENATIDGISKRVLASIPETDDEEPTEQKIYLSYPRGDHIYHDPTMIIYSADIPLDWTLFIITGTILGFVVLVGVAAILFQRKRKSK